MRAHIWYHGVYTIVLMMLTLASCCQPLRRFIQFAHVNHLQLSFDLTKWSFEIVSSLFCRCLLYHSLTCFTFMPNHKTCITTHAIISMRRLKSTHKSLSLAWRCRVSSCERPPHIVSWSPCSHSSLRLPRTSYATDNPCQYFRPLLCHLENVEYHSALSPTWHSTIGLHKAFLPIL